MVLALPLRADTVVMKDSGLKIDGKVLRETEEFIVLLVYEDHGQIRIPRSKIKSIEYDIKSQLSSLNDDDISGKYRVGVWAMQKGLWPDATSLLESIKGKEGAGPDLMKRLGECYEKQKELDKALEAFTEYARLHPDDKATADHIAELAKQVNPDANPADPKTAKKIVDGLEGGGTWAAENGWGISNTVQMVTENGNKLVSSTSQGGNKDKAAFSYNGQRLDLSTTKQMLFKVSHTCNKPINIAIGFINSNNEFYESKHLKCATGAWSDQVLKIDGKDFKCAATDWKFESDLKGKENIKTIVFLVYEQRPYTLWIDSVFFK